MVRRRFMLYVHPGQRRRGYGLDFLSRPLSTTYSEHPCRDHGGLAIFIDGFSSILTGLNFIVTVHRMRAPGLTWTRLPLFVLGQLRHSV